MTMNYEIIKTRGGLYLAGEIAAGVTGFKFLTGLCAANPEKLDQRRDRRGYLKEVIGPLVAAGTISDTEVRDPNTGQVIKYNDLKFRNDGMEIEGGVLQIHLGISHFLAFRADQKRADDENIGLQRRGEKDLGDRWLYLQHNPGVAGLVLDNLGQPYLGSRTNAEATGKLNSVAGHLQYQEDLKVDLLANVRDECREEMGIQAGDIRNIRFVGGFGNDVAGDHDFTFVVETCLDPSYFANNGPWSSQRKTREHDELICLPTDNEIRQLLEEGRLPGRDKQFGIMYSTRGGLEEFLRLRA